ncbi:Hypothetical predicted protein [Marmota monax]|uniref:Uncharacterized protein n=1 Tax=Marmota monax TaxID=9995 RepID=A0A5E4CC00_MARMO|nr:hypothetical protein GHT09_005135 [Marmota monax]VTJ79383.1 Hypothetical predicted protein [Marmota monax]
MQRLLERPCPEQFGEKYRLELPLTPEVVLKPAASKNCLQRLTEFVWSVLTLRLGRGLEYGGVLDHMRWPSSAKLCVLRTLPVLENGDWQCRKSWQLRGTRTPLPKKGTRQKMVGGSGEEAPTFRSPSPYLPGAQGSASARRKASLLPLQLLRLSSVQPGVVVPRPERIGRKGSAKDSTHLQIPKWRYKEAKEEKKKAEEAERKRQEKAQKEKQAPSWRKRTCRASAAGGGGGRRAPAGRRAGTGP